MAAIQLSFTLRTSSNVKTVHLLGSWDNYSGQLPLSRDANKSGGWKGTFRFQGATLQQGQRYWYYYIMDGYHVSHDPAQPSTTEPTTGRSLNILDVPHGKSSSSYSSQPSKRSSTASQQGIPKGRSLSPSKIAHPKPSKPYASRNIREADYSHSPGVDDLTSQMEQSSISSKYGYRLQSASPPSSVGSSLSSRSSGNRSSGNSSPSSFSSLSDPAGSQCRCNRYGITRKGDRVKLDCGGSRCGYSDDSSSGCSSDASDSEPEIVERRPRYAAMRR